jgi:hypothetical protein
LLLILNYFSPGSLSHARLRSLQTHFYAFSFDPHNCPAFPLPCLCSLQPQQIRHRPFLTFLASFPGSKCSCANQRFRRPYWYHEVLRLHQNEVVYIVRRLLPNFPRDPCIPSDCMGASWKLLHRRQLRERFQGCGNGEISSSVFQVLFT